MKDQVDMIDIPGLFATEQIEAVEAAEQWVEDAENAIILLAKKCAEFTADDVWALCPNVPTSSALGSLMRSAAHRRIIRRTGRWVDSVRPERRQGPVQIYVSLIK